MKKLMVMMTLTMMLVAAVACADEVAIGAKAPQFSLVNAVDGKTVAMKPDDGNLKVVVFTCNQCPYAKAFEPRIIEVARRFEQKGVRFYAVDSNDDAQYNVETLANMKARAVEKEYPFPYLKDGDSSIARAYGARVTPHIFVVDGQGIVRYRGYVDDSRAFGCTIKFKD
jgi:thiol-disulfide isomerase/thioredoxin